MKDKICLITGATSGIGKVAAMELARLGATLIIHGRNEKKIEETKQEIIKKTGNNKIDILLADLSLMQEVRDLVLDFNSKYERLDILINNAGGVMDEERTVTAEGLEKTIAVNHLAPFLLSSLLMDKLKKSKEARIINLSSIAYNMARPDFNNFLLERKYGSMVAYGNAKLYLLLFTVELAKRLKEKGIDTIKVFAMHPGIVKTNFSLDSNSKMKTFFKLFNLFLISPEKGADTLIYLATSEEVKKYSGEFFKKRKKMKVRRDLVNSSNQKKVWEISEVFTRQKFAF